ncbi:MAG TPA: alpha/beta hydrolase [Oceanospirillaceae bacterium]|nr:alpha/beta hydrolase [Oceanospirillaceae bacterium]
MTICDYRISGAPLDSAPVLMLIHGIGASKHTWDGLLAHMPPSYTYVSYDLRGHGNSFLPEIPFGLQELVDDVEALRAHLKIEHIHLAGHSLGGMIGPAYAKQYPQHTLSVGLLSTAAGRTVEDSAKVNGLVKLLAEQGAEPVLEALINRWFTDEFAAQNPQVIAQRKRQVLDTPADVFLQVFDIYANTEMAPWLKTVKSPCLVLTGAQDGGCNPRLNRFIDSQLDNSQLVILENLKHAILLEAPARVAQSLIQFLAHI